MLSRLYSKPCLKQPLKRRPELGFKTDNRLLQAKVLQNAPKHSAILSACIKLTIVFNPFVLSIFERPINTGLLYLVLFQASI